MSKLNPPIIEGTVPAFYGSKLEVPYSMNKTVGKSSIKSFSLKMKTVQSNYYLGEVESNLISNDTIIFNLPSSITDKLNVGQYYKIQVAYIDNTGLIGFYSTVATVKYTSQPSVTISNDTDGSTYIGVFSQEMSDGGYGDITEKVYSYQFDLKDNKGQLLETSGELLHDNSQDTEIYESHDSFTITYELEPNITYYLTYTVKTINGMEISSQAKRLYKTDSIDSNLKTDLVVKLNYEDGYVDVSLQKPADMDVEESAVGSFILLRADSESNFKVWNEVLKFVLYGQQPSRHLWKDMTVKQGVSYKYAVQQYNTYGLRSNRIESNTVKVDYEYAFLFDGERQLKIKYNPKVSSFKNTVLESKVDTIGSQYPFIFRNGNVKYKEFPVSGLISLLSDENKLFYGIDFDDITESRPDNKHSSITQVVEGPINEATYLKYYFSYYVKEKYEYKKENKNHEIEIIKTIYFYTSLFDYLKKQGIKSNQLLIWGTVRPTISRLFGEGLLYENTRLQEYSNIDFDNQPTTDLTSKNIYNERNFKLEALEWLTNGKPKLFRSPTEGNYLVRLLNVSLSPNDTLGRMLHTFNATAYEINECTYEALRDCNIIRTEDVTTEQLRIQSVNLSYKTLKYGENLLDYPASSVRLEGLAPGEKIQFIINSVVNEIVIGVTGSYLIELEDDILVDSLCFISGPSEMAHQGMLTYAYYTSDFRDSFDTINTITLNHTPARQFISYHDINLLEDLTNVKDKLQSLGQIKFTLRDDGDLELYRQDTEDDYYYSTDKEGNNEYKLVPHSSLSIYKIYSKEKELIGYVDGYSLEEFSAEEMESHEATSAWINNEQIDLYDTYSYNLYAPKDIQSIKIGKAVICELTYQSKIISYDIENTSEAVKEARANYDEACKKLNKLITNSVIELSTIVAQEEECDKLYKEFLKQVENAIAEAERR